MSIKPYTEERPWGRFEEFIKNERSTVKILTINAGEELSLQIHENREEFWHVISGNGEAVVGDSVIQLSPKSEYTIPPKTEHQIKAKTTLKILEVSLGEFDESDIVRIKDKYNRI